MSVLLSAGIRCVTRKPQSASVFVPVRLYLFISGSGERMFLAASAIGERRELKESQADSYVLATDTISICFHVFLILHTHINIPYGCGKARLSVNGVTFTWFSILDIKLKKTVIRGVAAGNYF